MRQGQERSWCKNAQTFLCAFNGGTTISYWQLQETEVVPRFGLSCAGINSETRILN
jgi:hypothetical protein